jgi:phospholipid/cholesterol/gamma-HCH transport system substrate-binding protein
MEKNANYAMVGLSALILSIGLVIFIVWLARWQFRQENDLYDILFQGPVRGLNQGGEVHFNGIKVGEVTRIALDRTNPSRVIARARVTSDVPIRVDSYATLEPQGITGVNYIQITAGTPSKPLLKDTVPDDKIPIIRSQRSTLSDLLEGGGTVLTRTIEALDRVNRVLSDQNIKNFSAAVSDGQAFTAELRERKAIIADAQSALQRIDQVGAELTLLLQDSRTLVNGDGRRTLANVADAAEEAKIAAQEARGLISSLQAPTTDFATNGLPQITAAVIQLQSAAESLEAAPAPSPSRTPRNWRSRLDPRQSPPAPDRSGLRRPDAQRLHLAVAQERPGAALSFRSDARRRGGAGDGRCGPRCGLPRQQQLPERGRRRPAAGDHRVGGVLHRGFALGRAGVRPLGSGGAGRLRRRAWPGAAGLPWRTLAGRLHPAPRRAEFRDPLPERPGRRAHRAGARARGAQPPPQRRLRA